MDTLALFDTLDTPGTTPGAEREHFPEDCPAALDAATRTGCAMTDAGNHAYAVALCRNGACLMQPRPADGGPTPSDTAMNRAARAHDDAQLPHTDRGPTPCPCGRHAWNDPAPELDADDLEDDDHHAAAAVHDFMDARRMTDPTPDADRGALF